MGDWLCKASHCLLWHQQGAFCSEGIDWPHGSHSDVWVVGVTHRCWAQGAREQRPGRQTSAGHYLMGCWCPIPVWCCGLQIWWWWVVWWEMGWESGLIPGLCEHHRHPSDSQECRRCWWSRLQCSFWWWGLTWVWAINLWLLLMLCCRPRRRLISSLLMCAWIYFILMLQSLFNLFFDFRAQMS